MNIPSKVKITSVAQVLLVIYCIAIAALVLKIEDELQQTQDVLITTKKQADANSELALLLAKLRESDKGSPGNDIVPMFPHIEYD